MEFEWTTFFLEILNFLVLLWLLQRFLYKPVQAVIARRRADIEQQLAVARTIQDQAEALRLQYENRLADWEREKEQTRLQLIEALAQEESRRREQMQQALAQEQEKARALENRRRQELLEQLGQQAVALGARFVARLLSRLASPALEASLVTMVVEDLAAHKLDGGNALQRALQEDSVQIASAYPLAETQRQVLLDALRRLAGHDIGATFTQNGDLLAGLRISAGSCLLHANLRDELEFFTKAADHGG
jgi:F-type H+-transporting ATPase subunit b